MLIQTRCMLGCLSGASGMFLNPWFRWAALQPYSGSVFSLSCEVKAISFFLFLLLCPSRSRTGLRTPGGDWRIQWGSRTWAGRWGSNSTTNMSRATQRGWASAATTAAQKVRLQPWRRSPLFWFSKKTVHVGWLPICQDHSWITESDPRPPQTIKPRA